MYDLSIAASGSSSLSGLATPTPREQLREALVSERLSLSGLATQALLCLGYEKMHDGAHATLAVLRAQYYALVVVQALVHRM